MGPCRQPGLDRLGSQDLFQLPLRHSRGLEPIGVVLIPDQSEGRVVFEASVLLPDEEFVGLELIRGRISRGRNRWKG